MYLLANLVTVVFLVLLMLAIASASARPPTADVINAGALAMPSTARAIDPQLTHDAGGSAQGLAHSADWR